MKKTSSNPSLVQDISEIARLYRDVLKAMAQRVQHGPEWQYRIREYPPDSIPYDARDRDAEPVGARSGHHN